MYLPKLVEFTKLKLLMVAVATSKRTELLMLKASARNVSACDSVIFQDFPRPISILKNPGPRSSFRCPDSPGKALRNELVAAPKLLNTFGFPLASINVPVLIGAVWKADEVNSQFVDQNLRLGPTPKGYPLVHVAKPESFQPPSTAYDTPCRSPVPPFPRPTRTPH